MARDYTFCYKLLDNEGNEHTYVTVAHAPMKGVKLIAQMGAIVGEPVLAALGSFLASGQELDGFLDSEAGFEALRALDMDAASAKIANYLMTGDHSGMICDILSETSRDGDPLVSRGKETPAFDAAYRMNYMELGKALREVIQRNDFLPLHAISDAVQAFAVKNPAKKTAPE